MSAFGAFKSLRRSKRKQRELEEEQQYESIQATRPWFIRSEIPFRLGRSTILYKLGYLTVVIFFTVLVFNVPRTNALDGRGDLKQVSKLVEFLIS